MSDAEQPGAMLQYEDWKKWPKSSRLPTHEEWYQEATIRSTELSRLRAEIERLKRELERSQNGKTRTESPATEA